MTQEVYISLIHQSLSGQISHVDQLKLDQWRRDAPENEAIFADIATIWASGANFIPKTIAVDTDRAFNTFKNQLIKTKTDTDTDKIRPLPRSWVKPLLRIAAIGLLLIVSVITFQYLKTDQMVEFLAANEKLEVTLPDQSVILLNKNARLTYDPDFAVRRVKLDGEAFFQITKNTQRPFVVEAKNTEIEVLGTSFNISTANQKVEVAVFTGKVAFREMQNQRNKLILLPRQKGVFETASGHLQLVEAVNLESITWSKDNLSFMDQRVKDLIPILEDFYQVDIQLANPSIGNCSFTGAFDRGNVSEALQGLAFGLSLDLEQNNGIYQLSGLGCK